MFVISLSKAVKKDFDSCNKGCEHMNNVLNMSCEVKIFKREFMLNDTLYDLIRKWSTKKTKKLILFLA